MATSTQIQASSAVRRRSFSLGKLLDLVAIVVLGIGAILMILPFLLMFSTSLRLSDVFYRYGGEEFCVALPDTDGPSAQKALAVECKVQTSAGTADEKIPYTLQDLAAMHVPAFVVYAGAGFSEGVLHLLRSSERAAYCLPDVTLEPSADTLELDHIVAMTFGWWEAVLRDKKPFDLSAWAAAQSEPIAPPQSRVVAEDPVTLQLELEAR